MKANPVTVTEQEGMDSVATTVQPPLGERVPFPFTVKNLVATSRLVPITYSAKVESIHNFVFDQFGKCRKLEVHVDLQFLDVLHFGAIP